MHKYIGFVLFSLAVIPFVGFLTISEWVNNKLGLPEGAAGPLGWAAIIGACVFIGWVIIYTLKGWGIIKTKKPSEPKS